MNLQDIEIQRIHIYKPYEGCLAGLPSPQECVASAKAKARDLLCQGRSIPIVVIDPEETECEASQAGRQPKLIPRWAQLALLEGPALSEDDDGSELIAIWFAKEMSPNIRALLPKLDWEKNAIGYQI